MSAPKYIDPQAVRSLTQYSRVEQLRRIMWGVGAVLFKLVPRPFHHFRCRILRLFGADIGARCTIASSAIIFFPWNLKMGDDCAIGDWALIYNLGHVQMGDRVTVSHRAHLCAGTHEFSKIDSPLLKLPIVLEDEVWVCADAFVGPGVRIAAGGILGAASVLTKDTEDGLIYAGNPASIIRERPVPHVSSDGSL